MLNYSSLILFRNLVMVTNFRAYFSHYIFGYMFCINTFYINEYNKYRLQIAKYYEINRIK